MQIPAQPHILVVDDDPEICHLIKDFLCRHGYQVTTALNGIMMHAVLEKVTIDLIILDIMMPGDDGLTLCQALRKESSIPIIMLSAMGDDTDRIVGLEVGADDYLPKPFNPRELLARVKAILRRVDSVNERQPEKSTVKIYFENWTLDCQKRCLIDANNLVVPLSTGEYDLLMAFVKHANQVLNRDQLLDLTTERNSSPFDRSIDVQVGRLRKKIEDDPKDPTIIKTVRGGGYQFISKVKDDKNICN